MGALGRYKIDGNDWYGTYGFVVSKGSDDFLKFHERKPSLSYDWPDEDGLEIDLSAPMFKDKPITLEGTMLAGTAAEFWTRYDALFTLLALPGLRTIYVNEFNRSFQVYYLSCPSVTRLTSIQTNEGGGIGCRLALNFVQPVPGSIKGTDPVITDSFPYSLPLTFGSGGTGTTTTDGLPYNLPITLT